MIMAYRDFYPEIHEKTFVAENAAVIGNVKIGCESSVWFGAVIRGEAPIIIGEKCNVQDNAVIHCDLEYEVVLGDGVTVGHSANVHGCKVGENTVIGMGAIVMNDAVIGKNCVVAAGAVVTGGTVVPDGSIVVGCPAKVLKKADEKSVENNRLNAKEYAAVASEYGKWEK